MHRHNDLGYRRLGVYIIDDWPIRRRTAAARSGATSQGNAFAHVRSGGSKSDKNPMSAALQLRPDNELMSDIAARQKRAKGDNTDVANCTSNPSSTVCATLVHERQYFRTAHVTGFEVIEFKSGRLN